MASKKKPATFGTADSFQNFASRLGQGTGNQHDRSTYGFHPVSRNRLQMEWCYRGSWICGMVVDCVAEDMTREGVIITTSDKPKKIRKLEKSFDFMQIWSQLCQVIKWDRLYGGALGFFMIDGQDPSTPLRIETIRKGQFKGILPLDRWMVNPSLGNLVTEMGPDFGLPKFYQTVPDTMGMPILNIHHSRVIRLGGVELPYWQKTTENLWGQSVMERLWDRLIAFDSSTTGAAQMTYKAHLRTVSVEGLREIIAAGGPAQQGLAKMIEFMARFQNTEGVTLLDAKDTFETHQYNFAGLDAILLQFGQQLSGAAQIPLVRLFGQSPAGLNSTGDSDLRTHYDNIKRTQVRSLGVGIDKLYRIGYHSTFGTEPPEEFEIDFKPLWQMSDQDKAEVANKKASVVINAYEAQIIDRATALRELKNIGRETGVFVHIPDELIAQAETDPPPSPEALGLRLPKPPKPAPGAPVGKKPAAKKPNKK